MSSSRRIRPSSPGQRVVAPSWLGMSRQIQIGDLKSFYVQKIAELNMTVLTTTDTANAYAVAFGTDETGQGLGATVAIQNSGDVSNVVVTVAEGTN